MSIETKKDRPGVTFHMESCDEGGLLTGKLQLSMRITATVDSRETLEKVKKKFDGGLTVHIVDDFKNVLIKVLQEDNTNYEQRIRELEIQLMNSRKEVLSLKEQMGRANTEEFLRRRGNI